MSDHVDQCFQSDLQLHPQSAHALALHLRRLNTSALVAEDATSQAVAAQDPAAASLPDQAPSFNPNKYITYRTKRLGLIKVLQWLCMTLDAQPAKKIPYPTGARRPAALLRVWPDKGKTGTTAPFAGLGRSQGVSCHGQETCTPHVHHI